MVQWKQIRGGRPLKKSGLRHQTTGRRIFPPVTCFVKCSLFTSQSGYKHRRIIFPLRGGFRKAFALPTAAYFVAQHRPPPIITTNEAQTQQICRAPAVTSCTPCDETRGLRTRERSSNAAEKKKKSSGNQSARFGINRKNRCNNDPFCIVR